MSDSINEQRCEQHGQPKAHWYQRFSERGVPIGKLWCPGPSVVAPPAQDEQLCNCGHLRSDHFLNSPTSCRFTACRCGSFVSVPAAPSMSTDHTDEKALEAELLRLCVPVQFSNGYPIEAIPKAALLDFFAIRALGAEGA